MLEINSKNIRFLSRMGAQGVLGQVVYENACDDADFFALSADLGIPSGFERIMKQFPDKFLDIGIAEANMLSVAAGIADEKTPAIATSWSPFATYRCADQMRVFMGCMRKNIKVIGMGSGLHTPYLGSSHYGVGDVAVAMSIPGIDVIAPADGLEIYAALNAALKNDRPTYIRLTGGDTLPMIYKEDFRFEIGKANLIKQGSDVLIVGCGYILSETIKAAEILEKNGISCTVADMHTIKPIDTEFLKTASDYRLTVTVEEHSVFGGLGSAVLKALSELNIQKPFCSLGIDDFFPTVGSYSYLLKQCGLDSESIADRIMKKLEKINNNNSVN
ncbi:MAG: transketolase [Clostridia bacterium]|nr:transketolase [Clostridia bacterium]